MGRGVADTAAVSVLFSEPKIPQWSYPSGTDNRDGRFQCSSASRKFLNRFAPTSGTRSKIVSVLFSEPKIPQSNPSTSIDTPVPSFSALQRAENSSIGLAKKLHCAVDGFSALQRAENSSIQRAVSIFNPQYSSFSALQRAENSSISLAWTLS